MGKFKMNYFVLGLSFFVLSFSLAIFGTFEASAVEKSEYDPKVVSYTEPAGDHGYYLEAPDLLLLLDEKVMEQHKEEIETNQEKYFFSFENADGVCASGEFPVNIPAEWFSEGKNILKVWSEHSEAVIESETAETDHENGDNGNGIIKSHESEYVFFLDDGIPTGYAVSEKGWSSWYRNQLIIGIHADENDGCRGEILSELDHNTESFTMPILQEKTGENKKTEKRYHTGSGIAEIIMECDDVLLLHESYEEYGCYTYDNHILIDIGGIGTGVHNLTLRIRDYGGNEYTTRYSLRVDAESPRITGTGIPDGSMQGEKYQGEISVSESFPDMDSLQCTLDYSSMKGESFRLTASGAGTVINENGLTATEILGGWQIDSESGKIFLPLSLNRSGYYHLTIEAADQAGNYQQVREDFVLDLDGPVIMRFQELGNEYYQEFHIPWTLKEMVEDMSEVTAEYRLDGLYYDGKEIIKEPGLHLLRGIFTDAFGHVTEETVRFVIKKDGENYIEKEEPGSAKEDNTSVKTKLVQKKSNSDQEKKIEEGKERRKEEVSLEKKTNGLSFLWVLLPSLGILSGLAGFLYRKYKDEWWK